MAELIVFGAALVLVNLGWLYYRDKESARHQLERNYLMERVQRPEVLPAPVPFDEQLTREIPIPDEPTDEEEYEKVGQVMPTEADDGA